MNHSHLIYRRHHRWLRDLQFAVGVVVAIGGAAALLLDIVR